VSPEPGARLPLPTPELVMFDLDYTLLRPSDLFEAPGYQRTGARFGLDLDPGRWELAERGAYAAVRARRDVMGDVHDVGLMRVIAEAVITGMGGGEAAAVSACADAVVAAWSQTENFGLYDDVLPCLAALRAADVLIGVVSNAVGHDLEEVVAAFALEPYVDTAVGSAAVGVTKPAPQMFLAVLGATGVTPERAVMVGDSLEDDVRGALACGCAAILLDRAGRHEVALPTIASLLELPPALGLPAPA
jgi:HAD superfamily hydrolase (TIGR01509 family)